MIVCCVTHLYVRFAAELYFSQRPQRLKRRNAAFAAPLRSLRETIAPLREIKQ
jgi:hypothetical protein